MNRLFVWTLKFWCCRTRLFLIRFLHQILNERLLRLEFKTFEFSLPVDACSGNVAVAMTPVVGFEGLKL